MVMAKAYQKYKNAKLTWLEKVPEGWQILRGKTVFRCIDMRSKDGSEELLSVSSKDGVVPRSSKKITMFMAESYAGYKLCWPSDLVINSLWAWMFGLGFSRHHGIVSSAYGVYRTRSQYLDHWQYFDYLIRSKAYAWELRVRSRGVWTSRLQMTDDRFLDMPILIPPKEDAVEIVKFLSVLDIQIRRYIREKQKVIKLLNEQKQELINKAITRGIDPNVRLKPSGINWLGEIPDHWEIVNLRRVCKVVKTGSTPLGAEEKYYADEGFNWYTPGDFKHALYLQKSERQLSDLGVVNVRTFPKGTVMMIGIGATIGKVSIADCDASCNQQINAMVVNDMVSNEYFAYYLRFLKDFIVMCGKYTTLPIINQDETKSLPVLIPTAKEQKAIVDYINLEAKVLDDAIALEEHAIDSIREYRTRLISDVVTGKIDVRDIKLPEFEDITDSEQIEEREILEDVEDAEEVVNADE